VHAVGASRDLGLEGFARGGEGIGVGHFEHARHATHDRRKGARFEVFLVGQARLAEMNLGVDDAGQDMKALAVNGFGGGIISEAADGCDAAVANRDVGDSFPVLVDQSGVLENGVVLRHVFGPPCPVLPPGLADPSSERQVCHVCLSARRPCRVPFFRCRRAQTA
jgi:hypothetical protein